MTRDNEDQENPKQKRQRADSFSSDSDKHFDDKSYDSGDEGGYEITAQTLNLYGDLSIVAQNNKYRLYFNKKLFHKRNMGDLLKEDLINTLNISDQKIISSIHARDEYISFFDREILDRWIEARYLKVKELTEKRENKKIVVYGIGCVGEAVVREIISYHERIEKGCDIIVMNRNIEYLQQRVKEISSQINRTRISLNCAENSQVLSGADLIIITSGVNAASIKSKSRDESYEYNAGIIAKYGEQIREFAPESKILLITNPIERLSLLLVKHNGLDPTKIFGSGVNLDSIRYKQFIVEELKKIGVYNLEIEDVMVIGQHSRDGMFFMNDQIKIEGKSVQDFISQTRLFSQEQWQNVLFESEAKTREEGFKMVNIHHRTGAYLIPAQAACEVASGLLYGSEKAIPVATYYCNSSGQACFIGLPVSFERQTNGEVLIKPENDNIFLVQNQIQEQIRREADSPRVADLLARSILLNDLLDKERAKPMLMSDLMNIKFSSMEDFISSNDSINKIFRFNFFVDNREEKLKISLKDDYKNVSDKEVLSFLLNGLQSLGLLNNNKLKDSPVPSSVNILLEQNSNLKSTIESILIKEPSRSLEARQVSKLAVVNESYLSNPQK
ncbi:MAG: hypothetical protein SFV53_06350 [Rickettsiales bacterium]|nr:hypothetical protein [Rickettsiales bacterium]